MKFKNRPIYLIQWFSTVTMELAGDLWHKGRRAREFLGKGNLCLGAVLRGMIGVYGSESPQRP